MNLTRNCCDGIYNSFDVHFTSACDNECAHCIDNKYQGTGIVHPNIDAIIDTIVTNSDGVDDVLFLGGEPCIFLDDLVKCVSILKEKTNLKLYVTTSVPAICYREREVFERLLTMVEGINLSVQHYDEKVADTIRRTKSTYDRQKFYKSLGDSSFANKIRINLNIVKPYLYTKEDISKCLRHYDSMGFNSIKLSEIQHGKEYFVSFEKLFGINLGSPYSDGCQTYLNMEEFLPGFKTPVLLKRSCFVCEETLKANLKDGYKVVRSLFVTQKNKYGVIYENGSLEKGWV